MSIIEMLILRFRFTHGWWTALVCRFALARRHLALIVVVVVI